MIQVLEPNGKTRTILEHSGVTGMRWGFRKDDRKGSKVPKSESKSKLDKHPAMAKYGKDPIKNGRRMRALMDVGHIDIKTGEYTNQSKLAKTTRVVEKVVGGTLATASLVKYLL